MSVVEGADRVVARIRSCSEIKENWLNPHHPIHWVEQERGVANVLSNRRRITAGLSDV